MGQHVSTIEHFLERPSSPGAANLSAGRSGGKFRDNSLQLHGDAGFMLRRGTSHRYGRDFMDSNLPSARKTQDRPREDVLGRREEISGRRAGPVRKIMLASWPTLLTTAAMRRSRRSHALTCTA